jgi:hypothetical protein
MKTGGKRLYISMLLALSLLLPGLPALAQNKPEDTMPLVRDAVKADKKLFVAQVMQLTESEAKAFWPIYDNYQKDLAKIYDRTMLMIRDYASNHQSMTNEIAKRLTVELLAIGMDHQKLKENYWPLFSGALSDIKVARYYQLENKISAAIAYDAANNIPLISGSK